MKNLPQELILEILLRLPVKSLLRCRSVSKLWLSLISDPQFGISHFELSSKHHRLINIAGSEARSVDFEASFHDDSSIVNLSFPPTSPSEIDIVGSCRGFLLLVDNFQFSNMCIWNPSTGFCKRLYFPSFSKIDPFIYGFGYDDSIDDYLVVLGSCYFNSTEDLVTHFEIFSLKSNSWEEIKGTHFSYEDVVFDSHGGTILSGAIHWLVYDQDASAWVILAFDLTERVFRELPIFDDEFRYKLELAAFGVHGRWLSLSFVDEDVTEIWIMKEYGVKSSWTKSIIVSVEHVPRKYFSPICLTKDGDIVGTYGSCTSYGRITGLLKFNCKGELLEQHAYNHQPRRSQVAVYIESLLSLPNS